MTLPDNLAMSEKDVLASQLEILKRTHRDLDAEIHEIAEHTPFDQLSLQRLKREKLQLKDRIKRIEDRLVPDIIA